MQLQSELTLRPEEAAGDESILLAIAAKTGVPFNDITGFHIVKKSIDARSREVKVRMMVNVFVKEPFHEPVIPGRSLRNVKDSREIYIAGCGPAGLFAALRLIELGLKPVIIERGKDVKSRRRDLAAINRQGKVNPESNYCFGEGGAGTYSDGKLYTRSGKRGSIERILQTFTEFGANTSILADAHPHIGTNKLPGIITAMREAIISCGGEIHFNTKLTGISRTSGGITGIYIKDNDSEKELYIECSHLVLATGHSARDIFRMLHENGILIESKPVAIGVRIEHQQQLIDKIQYHCNSRGEYLPPASYSLVHQSGERGVYSFCMCPGGIIAPAATNADEVVVNGWSPSKRNNPYANSGIVVSVSEHDCGSDSNDALAVMKYQEKIEKQAWISGGGMLKAPAQRMMDFISNKNSSTLPDCSYLPGLTSVNLTEVLPPEISNALREGLSAFGKKMKGYLTNDAVLVGVESRTSSPVRIPRDPQTLMHTGVSGLFPCAEGAGYAGGIVSAAMDGERVAEAVYSMIQSEI